MSTGDRIGPAQAEALAARVVFELGPYCERIEAGGSVRRRRVTVGDLEIVAIPRTVPATQGGLFDSVQVSALWAELDRLVDAGSGWERAPGTVGKCPRCAGAGGYADVQCSMCLASGVVTRAAPWGERYRQALYRGRQVDLFTARPATWGAILLIRTGSADYSARWVTALRDRGFRMAGGQVVDGEGAPVSVPDEETALRLVGWAWCAPEERA